MELFLLILQIPILIILIKYIRKLHSDTLLVNSYYYLVSFKVTAGLLLGIIYFSYYKGGDTIFYNYHFEFLKKLAESDLKGYLKMIVLGDIPPHLSNTNYLFDQERAFTFIRICSPIYIFSGSNYWILSIYLSLFSFTGFWILSKTLITLYKVKPLVVLLAFFIFPSVVFWSSGVMKESLVMGLLCIVVSLFLNFLHHKKEFSFWKGLIFLILACLLFYIKFYYFAVLFVVLIPYGLVHYFSFRIRILKENKFYKLLLFGLVLFFSALLVSYSYPLINIDTLSSALYSNYKAMLLRSSSTSSYRFEGLTSDPVSFIRHLPQALFYGLFGPLLGQCRKVIALFTGIENTILLLVFCTFVIHNLKKYKEVKLSIEALAIGVYVCVLAIFMAFASPNWGSLVRYKVAYMPFFLLLLLTNNPAVVQLEKWCPFLKLPEKKS